LMGLLTMSFHEEQLPSGPITILSPLARTAFSYAVYEPPH
jgi:hypothetical protein